VTDDAQEPCENDDCDKCHPIPRWRVSTTSVERRKHEREFKAATPEEALARYAEGTAWPADYDTSTLEVIEEFEPVVVPVTDERHLQCFHDLARSLGSVLGDPAPTPNVTEDA
jgi:hypothetical protein